RLTGNGRPLACWWLDRLLRLARTDRWVRTCRRGCRSRRRPVVATWRSQVTVVWAGIDTGKRTHHCVVLDAGGHVLLSQRVGNDETALLHLIAAVHGV